MGINPHTKLFNGNTRMAQHLQMPCTADQSGQNHCWLLPPSAWEASWDLQLQTRLASRVRESLKRIMPKRRAISLLFFIYSITPSLHKASCSYSSIQSAGTWEWTLQVRVWGRDGPAPPVCHTEFPDARRTNMHTTKLQNLLAKRTF